MAPVTVDRALTTPSNLHRRLLCPGSARLESGLGGNTSALASKGLLIHRYFTNKNYDRRLLTVDERELLETSDQLLAKVLNVLGFEDDHETHSEELISGIDGRLSGTPDQVFIWRSQKDALVNDLKSGFAVVERAELNLQLRGYAVLVSENFDMERIYVSILQPRLWSPSEQITIAQYDRNDMRKARQHIREIIDRTEDPDAPLVAGEEQCRYCRAKLICPAFRAALALPIAAFKTSAELSKRKHAVEIEKRLKGCDDQQLEQLLEAIKLAAVVDESVRAECRARIRVGKFKKFMLAKESEARTITDVRKAISLLALSGIASREEIIDLCTLSLKAIENTFRERRRSITWKQARDRIDRVLKSVITREPREPKILLKERKK